MDSMYNLSIDKSKYVKGSVGLQNLGNTCYINSVIQCVRHNLEFSGYFLQKLFVEDLNENTIQKHLCIEWYNLIENLWSDRGTVFPVRFLRTFEAVCSKINKHMFVGNSQNDSEEFLNLLFDIFHEGLKSNTTITISGVPKNKNDIIQLESYKEFSKHAKTDGISPITKFYGGQFISQISNSFDEKISNSFELFTYVNLEIPTKETTLHDCFNNFCRKELLDEYKNDRYPENTKYFKKMHLINVPEHLVIVLKRFNPDGSKNRTKINYPCNLDLEKFILGYAKNTKYDLYGVVCHIGNSKGGHYISIVKNSSNEWNMYNDQHIKSCDVGIIINNKAYMLFYKIINT